jgi:Haem-binding domain
MKKSWIIPGSVLLLFIVIQFFRPEKNDKVANPQNDIVFALDIPSPVKKKIVDACYDCHSNRTKYPFYNRIAPVSWLMAKHIREGKENLNFSEWANYDKKEQIKLLTAICEEITEGEMPIKSYVFMHSRAVLNEKEIGEICQWTETASEQIMAKSN